MLYNLLYDKTIIDINIHKNKQLTHTTLQLIFVLTNHCYHQRSPDYQILMLKINIYIYIPINTYIYPHIPAYTYVYPNIPTHTHTYPYIPKHTYTYTYIP